MRGGEDYASLSARFKWCAPLVRPRFGTRRRRGRGRGLVVVVLVNLSGGEWGQGMSVKRSVGFQKEMPKGSQCVKGEQKHQATQECNQIVSNRTCLSQMMTARQHLLFITRRKSYESLCDLVCNFNIIKNIRPNKVENSVLFASLFFLWYHQHN